jgi:ADP-heptose:LPS heptosyltransferase
MAKPKLLVVELWGLGDLVIATPFLRAASQHYSVTLVARPYAKDLQNRLWPEVNIVPFTAPWTAFKNKYRFHAWPWREFFKLRKQLAIEKFDVGLSARWDPRDHFLLAAVRAKQRLGFSRMQSRVFLTHPVARPEPAAHRYEYWRVLAQALNLELPAQPRLPVSTIPTGNEILLHSGAGQPVRVWPLERYARLASKLRAAGHRVQVVCDNDQRDWWLSVGEKSAVMPETVAQLLALIDRAGVFIGNDSGPGHLAAFCGVPPLTIFGPQLPEWFAPLHPAAQWIEGKACPFKPCSDYCRFRLPVCIDNISEEEVFATAENFARKNLAAR